MSEGVYKFHKSNVETGCMTSEVHLLVIQKINYVIMIILSIITVGILPIVLNWSFTFKVRILYKKTIDLERATHFLVINEKKMRIICKKIRVQVRNVFSHQIEEWEGFHHLKLKYVLRDQPDNSGKQFQALEFPLSEISFAQLSQYSFLDDDQVLERRGEYGECKMEINVPNFLMYLLREITTPFYLLQIASIIIWYLQDYWVFAVAILVFQLGISLFNYIMTRIFLLKIKKLAHQTFFIKVYRTYCPEGKIIDSTQLVVGDVIKIRDKLTIPCDCILISGEIYANEGSLSGESIPIKKIAIDNDGDNKFDYSLIEHKKYFLFDGTVVYQLKNGAGGTVLARVVRVGFTTLKGQIIRSILLPKSTQFNLFHNSRNFFLSILIVMLLIYSSQFYNMVELDIPLSIYFYKLFDIITWVIPPFLPIFDSFNLSISMLRLRNRNILCIEPKKTVLAGQVTHMCFDKTGTLTSNGISVNGYFDASLQHKITSTDEIKYSFHQKLFATCHGVFLLDGQQTGDMLDIEMLRFSGYQITTSSDPRILFSATKDNSSLNIINMFDFDYDLQRMSVIVQDFPSRKCYGFIKGAPEVIKEICNPGSVPANFQSELNKLSMQGFRILAMCFREIDQAEDIVQLQRSDLEQNLTFLGLIVLENNLKSDTSKWMKRLLEGGIKCKIISGDSALTTIHTAKECGIFDSEEIIYLISSNTNSQNIEVQVIKNDETQQFESLNLIQVQELLDRNEQIAVTSDLLKYFEDLMNKLKIPTNKCIPFNNSINSEASSSIDDASTPNLVLQAKHVVLIFNQIIKQASVFARMRSQDKRYIIQILQKQGLKVGMIGDGANDSEAIQQAEIGIAFNLSDSAFSSPISSTNQSISCVEDVLRNGRTTLSNSIDIFRCFILQGFIKFAGALIMLQGIQNFGDFQFIFINFILGMPMIALISLSRPLKSLQSEIYSISFNNFYHMVSSYSQMVIFSIAMVIGLVILPAENENTKLKKEEQHQQESYLRVSGELNTVIFLMTMMFFIISGVSLQQSKPFKLQVYKNYPFVVFTAAYFIFCVLMILFQEIQPSSFSLSTSLYVQGRLTMVWILLISLATSALVIVLEEKLHKRFINPKSLKLNRI